MTSSTQEAAREPEIKVTIRTLSEVSKHLLRRIEALGPGIIWDSKSPKRSLCTSGALKDLAEELKTYSGYESARSEWTAVEDGLPEPNQAVWVTRRVDYSVVPRTFESPYTPEEFVAVFSAWMPRQTEPQPYQQGGE